MNMAECTHCDSPCRAWTLPSVLCTTPLPRSRKAPIGYCVTRPLARSSVDGDARRTETALNGLGAVIQRQRHGCNKNTIDFKTEMVENVKQIRLKLNITEIMESGKHHFEHHIAKFPKQIVIDINCQHDKDNEMLSMGVDVVSNQITNLPIDCWPSTPLQMMNCFLQISHKYSTCC